MFSWSRVTGKTKGNPNTTTVQKKGLAGFISNADHGGARPPFADKNASRLDVLIHVGGSGFEYGRKSRTPKVLTTLQKDLGEQKTNLQQKIVHRDILTNTLSTPGYELMTMPPFFSWSRMKNLNADIWRNNAYKKADAFIYPIEIENTEEYLHGGGGNGCTKEWEQDRSRVSSFLRHLVGYPKKPFLLIVLNNDKEEEIDFERLLNLLGLAGNRLERPFRVVVHASEDTAQDGELKEALKWLTETARSKDDEATAMTGDETEEEGSVGTFSTNGTVTSMPDFGGGHYILDYEPTLLAGNPTLQRFEPVQKGTFCPFARAAKLWGGKLANEHTPRLAARALDPLQEVATLNAGPLAEFVARSNSGEPLDGFCLEIPNSGYLNVERFGQKVSFLLTKLAELDPTPGENCMKMGPIDDPQWRFRFAGEDFFLTTFSPTYPKISSRHTFGVNRAFLLLQPISSFGRHGLIKDTPASSTRWDKPVSMRDKARVAFKKNGCPYHIPENLPYPAAEHVVKPKFDDGTTCIRWWEPLKTTK